MTHKLLQLLSHLVHNAYLFVVNVTSIIFSFSYYLLFIIHIYHARVFFHSSSSFFLSFFVHIIFFSFSFLFFSFQNKKYFCANGTFSNGSHVNSSPSAFTSNVFGSTSICGNASFNTISCFDISLQL